LKYLTRKILIIVFIVLFFANASCAMELQQTLPSNNFSLKEDTNLDVCQEYVKNLNNIQPDKISFSCDVKFAPDNEQFGWPKWQELNIEKYLDVIYSIETKIQPSAYWLNKKKWPNYEEWRKQYLEEMRTGYAIREGFANKKVKYTFTPRLRTTQVRLEPEGRIETILGYTREVNASERCIDAFSKCPPLDVVNQETIRRHRECTDSWSKDRGVSMDQVGEHIVLYESIDRKVHFIRSGDRGTGASSNGSYFLFLHNGRAYLALTSTSGVSLSSIESLFPEIPDKSWKEGKPICTIPSPYPRSANQ
jgi:hypothetical protein